MLSQEARRIALAAQGFDRPRPNGRVDRRHVRRVIHQLGLIQLDFVNVLVPAHYQVLFSRLGTYDRSILDDLMYRHREFTEHWAHEASIVPVEHWPLLRYRREDHRVQPWGFEKVLEKHAEYVEWVFRQVQERGGLLAESLPAPPNLPRMVHESWYGTVPRAVLEAHFGRGLLAISNRLPNFARVYDLSERIVPPHHHEARMNREDGQRELLRIAARAHGIATIADLADYYRMKVRDARPRVDELVEMGELMPVKVEGWRETAYLHHEARTPRRMEACSLLSPFDPVVWFRPRTERLFGFEHRFEIFVPPPKRRWGCYVLPFLLGDQLVARVDLKADRKARRLLVPAAYIEPNAKARDVIPPLIEELNTLAGWLGLDPPKRRDLLASINGPKSGRPVPLTVYSRVNRYASVR